MSEKTVPLWIFLSPGVTSRSWIVPFRLLSEKCHWRCDKASSDCASSLIGWLGPLAEIMNGSEVCLEQKARQSINGEILILSSGPTQKGTQLWLRQQQPQEPGNGV